MGDACKLGDFVFEAPGVGLVEGVPMAHDYIFPALQERVSGEAVAFITVHARRGGEQVPKVVVAPLGEREDMVYIESTADGIPAPDALL